MSKKLENLTNSNALEQCHRRDKADIRRHCIPCNCNHSTSWDGVEYSWSEQQRLPSIQMTGWPLRSKGGLPRELPAPLPFYPQGIREAHKRTGKCEATSDIVVVCSFAFSRPIVRTTYTWLIMHRLAQINASVSTYCYSFTNGLRQPLRHTLRMAHGANSGRVLGELTGTQVITHRRS